MTANPEAADLHRETGQRNNQIRKVVVSDSLTGADTAPWTEPTPSCPGRMRTGRSPSSRTSRGNDILMFGSRTVWNDLLAAGLVDELQLMVGAAVLGGGTPAFGAGPVPLLRLMDTRHRDGIVGCVDPRPATAAAAPDRPCWPGRAIRCRP